MFSLVAAINGIEVRPLRDFYGMDNCSTQTKTALIDFGYYLAIGALWLFAVLHLFVSKQMFSVVDFVVGCFLQLKGVPNFCRFVRAVALRGWCHLRAVAGNR